ncbi:PREDICTED: uncharacterized protein LOC109220861 [Nicotiana attenuata]|uniref:uncharacterized protein LOC109220861 n=1 Tax=Nicotiana attenuata TaxID=49451 RepID=UPI00090525A2|nr:PREDICTED: uncharacterized protein LOC109220861 [Nicotiana attenuata]
MNSGLQQHLHNTRHMYSGTCMKNRRRNGVRIIEWSKDEEDKAQKKEGEKRYYLGDLQDTIDKVQNHSHQRRHTDSYCGLTDLGFYGPKYTWSNGRGPGSIVWKRLDRGLANDEWLTSFPATTITHLASAGSDHSPLLLEINVRNENPKRYFKFLNCWTENKTFLPLVQSVWTRPFQGNPMWVFHQKIKALCSELSQWSRQQYGDIFQRVKEFENKVREAEERWAHSNNEKDRAILHELNAQYIKHLKTEEAVLRQKTQLNWFKEGDANSKYFHSLIRGRRRKLFIHKIKNENNEWIQGDEAIGEAACDHFQELFTDQGGMIREDLLSCIPNLITEEDNTALSKEPTIDEIKAVIFSMNPTSAAGPDGLNGKFYQHCWEIIKLDIFNVVNAFFCGYSMPKHMTQACLVLLPKTEFPSSLSDFRPISLSNFINKIISKLICHRLAPILPRIISPNQTGFVKGRNISENIMLAQEIVQGIKKPNVGGNVVIKLDMAKAYDRVSWAFTCIIMRRLGFNERIIDMVWRTLSNNWYSVIVNGTRCGFFHSTRGLKQGDPLAPALFIIGAELLSKMLNNMTHDQFFNGFYMERRGPQITHLSFADDIIIFTSGSRYSLHKIMGILQAYEQTSGQLINKNKSHFMVSPSAFQSTSRRVTQITGFSRKNSPITYLGCPLYTGRKRIIFFNSIISKVVSKIRGWHGKILSHGGRATLIKHVLQSLPIHLLSAVSPPKTVLKQIEKLAANFFWGMDHNRYKYHWASWQKLAKPQEEGGIGLRNIEDVCRSLEFKQWWWFRTKDSLWSKFLKAKYCQRSHPVSKKWDSGQSQAWKKMMSNKKDVEQHIQWHLISGNSSFWWDNWLGTGHLAPLRTSGGRPGNVQVSQFWDAGVWNTQKLSNLVPAHVIETILQTPIFYAPQTPDRPIWKPTSTGQFTSASAWKVIRNKGPLLFLNKKIWHQQIPFKWSFCLWRALRNKLPTDDRVAMFGPPSVNRCVCCRKHQAETISHIFNTGHFAKAIWKNFTATVGFPFSEMPLNTLLLKWWSLKTKNEVHSLLIDTLPIIICWNLWKNRCAAKYGTKQSSMARVIYSINSDINLMLHAKYPTLPWPTDWSLLYLFSETLQFQITTTLVTWQKPPPNYVKVNSDGSALLNPGKIGAGVIIRDHQGDFIHAIAAPLGEGSNNLAETEAALIGIRWCIDNGFTKIYLETDSALLIHWLTNGTPPPWSIVNSVQKLQQLGHQCSQGSSPLSPQTTGLVHLTKIKPVEQFSPHLHSKNLTYGAWFSSPRNMDTSGASIYLNAVYTRTCNQVMDQGSSMLPSPQFKEMDWSLGMPSDSGINITDVHSTEGTPSTPKILPQQPGYQTQVDNPLLSAPLPIPTAKAQLPRTMPGADAVAE